MSRLPQPGGDKGNWGDILNDFLDQSHNPDGTLKAQDDITDAKTKANSAVQSINNKTPTNGALTLAATDVSAEPAGLSDDTKTQLTNSFVAGTQVALATARSGHFAAVGDSITALGDPSSAGPPAVTDNRPQQYGYSWHTYLQAYSGGRLVRDGYFATPGYTMDQIVAEHIPQVIALKPKPEACFIGGGTNDLGNTSGTEWASLLSAISQLSAAGIRPILVAVPPRNDSDGALANGQAWNQKIWALASMQHLQVFDMWTPVINPANGRYVPQYTVDYIHPTDVARALIAQYNVNRPGWLDQFGDAGLQPQLISSDSTELISGSRGMFGTDSNSDGLADGWTVGGTGATFSLVQDADGYWRQNLKKIANATTVGSFYRAETVGFAPGDTLEVRCRLYTDNVLLSPGVLLDFRDNSNTSLGEPLQIDAAKALTGATWNGQLFYARGVVPVNAASFQILVQFGSAAIPVDATLGIKQLSVKKIPSLA